MAMSAVLRKLHEVFENEIDKYTTIPRTIFQEEVQKQLLNLPNFIKGNIVITKKEKRNLKKELSEFTASLEFTESGEFEQKVENKENNLDTLKEKAQEIYD